MKRVCKKQPKAFRIAFFSSLGTYLLPQVFELFLQAHPQLHLELPTPMVDSFCDCLREILTTHPKIESLL